MIFFALFLNFSSMEFFSVRKSQKSQVTHFDDFVFGYRFVRKCLCYWDIRHLKVNSIENWERAKFEWIFFLIFNNDTFFTEIILIYPMAMFSKALNALYSLVLHMLFYHDIDCAQCALNVIVHKTISFAKYILWENNIQITGRMKSMSACV